MTMPQGFNGITTPVEPNTAVKVLEANPSRKRVLFVNDSDAVIYLCKESKVALNIGIRINPLGGSYQEEPVLTGNGGAWMYYGSWYAYSGSASKILQVMEDA